MTDKAWTAEDDEALNAVSTRLNELIAKRDASNGRVRDSVHKFVDQKANYHELTLSQVENLIFNNRWILVDVLTEGEYQKLLSFRTLKLEQERSDD